MVGSIIGVGIFNLPTSMACYSPLSLVSMGGERSERWRWQRCSPLFPARAR
jgi:hypothetical protein